MKKTNIMFLFSALMLTLGIDACQNSQSTTETTVDSSKTMQQAPTSDIEAGTKLLEKGLDSLYAFNKKQRAENKKKDSMHLANRVPIWVYQIGVNKSSAEDFGDTYKKLTDVGVTNLFLMKQSKHSYLLVKNDDYELDQDLMDKQGDLEALMHQAGVSMEVKVKDLNKYCDVQYDAKLIGKEKMTRGEKVDCYSCQ